MYRRRERDGMDLAKERAEDAYLAELAAEKEAQRRAALTPDERWREDTEKQAAELFLQCKDDRWTLRWLEGKPLVGWEWRGRLEDDRRRLHEKMYGQPCPV